MTCAIPPKRPDRVRAAAAVAERRDKFLAIIDAIYDELSEPSIHTVALEARSRATGAHLVLVLRNCRPSVQAAWDSLVELMPESAALQLRYLYSVAKRMAPRTQPTLLSVDTTTDTVFSLTHNVSVRLDVLA